MTNSLRFVALAALAFAAPAFSQTHPGKLPVSSPFVREFNQAAFIAGGQAVSVDHDALLTVPENGEAIIADFPLSGGLGTDLVVHRIHPVAPDAQGDIDGRAVGERLVERHFEAPERRGLGFMLSVLPVFALLFAALAGALLA